MQKKIIDVSKWNGNINFAKVKADGVDGVIIRAGYGFKTVDPCFYNNITNAIANGLHIGIYWFGYASTVSQAQTEAKYLVNLLKDYSGQIDLPIYYDWEYDSYNYVKEHYNIKADKTLISNMTRAFCEVLENAGYFSGFYANIDYLTKYYTDDVKKRFTLWIAQWSSKCTYSGNYAIWQYTDCDKINGISSNVDSSYLYSDLPNIIKNGGFNGYSKITVDTSKFVYDVNQDGVVDEKDLQALEDYLRKQGIID